METLARDRLTDAEQWEAFIPHMGLFALIRNLRNFDEAKVSDSVVGHISGLLMDGVGIQRSRILPFRFWSAYKNAPASRWGHPLSVAADLACSNIPRLPGRTLVLVDVSASMEAPVSNRSTIARWETAAVGAGALARACEHADVVCFAARSEKVDLHPSAGVMRYVQEIKSIFESERCDHATFGHGAIRQWWDGHDRVVMFTDDQMHDSVENAADAARKYDRYYQGRGLASPTPQDISHVPLVWTVDLAGYGFSSTPVGGDGRYSLAGFSDASFVVMAAVEAQKDGKWPWEL